MPHHALEIMLTRPLSPTALLRAARVLPLAANHDATRLMALVPAKAPPPTGQPAVYATGSAHGCRST
ncbi:hypothetical protein ABZT02_41245 [Streptomyces sp. NPDC005402]|uniref:hypothetical protein n=1 Tax=Streptomyces sp. NPDC005402 TaxID=3155338 RepID=UPI0033A778D1